MRSMKSYSVSSCRERFSVILKPISSPGQQNHRRSVYISNNSYEVDVYVNMNYDEETVCEVALEVKRLLNRSHNNIAYIVHSPF